MNAGTQRLLFGLLGMLALVAGIGLVLIAMTDHAVPDALVALGSGAAGALAGAVTAHAVTGNGGP